MITRFLTTDEILAMVDDLSRRAEFLPEDERQNLRHVAYMLETQCMICLLMSAPGMTVVCAATGEIPEPR